MTWLKLDDGFPEHPKIADLSDAAFRAHVSAICFSARSLSDGRVPESFTKAHPRKAIRELQAVGLWTKAERGYEIHDYLDWQPSKADVMEKRRKESERKQGGIREESKRKDGRKKAGIQSPDLDVDTETPTSGSSNPATPPKASAEAKDLATYLKERLRERGVTAFARNWHLTGAAVADWLLRSGTDAETIRGTIDWALEDEFNATRVTKMEKVRDLVPQFQQRRAGVAGIPSVARMGTLDRIEYELTQEEVANGRSTSDEAGEQTRRSLPG